MSMQFLYVMPRTDSVAEDAFAVEDRATWRKHFAKLFKAVAHH